MAVKNSIFYISETFICPKKYYKCPNSYCVPLHMRCNGKNDCPRGEDELNCDNSNLSCPANLRCAGTNYCINDKKRCDGFPDCPKGDDEQFCGSCLNQLNRKILNYLCTDMDKCPEKCKCSGRIIECKNQNLTLLPNDLSTKARMM